MPVNGRRVIEAVTLTTYTWCAILQVRAEGPGPYLPKSCARPPLHWEVAMKTLDRDWRETLKGIQENRPAGFGTLRFERALLAHHWLWRARWNWRTR